ncbi:MAG TPA: beta-N-acetylhexosaminidase [Verrucomicrobiae bacterium]
MTQKSFVGLLLFAWATTLPAADQTPLAIIPVPQQVERPAGSFQLTPATRIYAAPELRETGEFIAAQLRSATGYSLKVETSSDARRADLNAIILTTTSTNTQLGAEGYELTVAAHSVVICAPTTAGIFYGGQTLRQLLPPEIFSTNQVSGVNWQMPAVHIADWPRFSWRGQMLDVSRHFYTKAEVETLLDLMALHKLNVFHWHLVDNQGWRIEIKKYPRLTQVGAWRKGIGWGLDPKASTAYRADGQYGGFYTQTDIRDVVAYATARHITIVPEIELPGHSAAALLAYPQFADYPGTNHPANYMVYDPANPEMFHFLEDVLTEIFALFPGKYIHIGGDEVAKTDWKNSPACQALMRREHLKNEEELQSWFIRQIATWVSAQGKTLVGWSEILQGGLAPDAVVMDWIGGGKEAAEAGHDVVMTPLTHCYLNYYQSTNFAAEPRAPLKHYIPLAKVYAFDPIPAGLPAAFQSHVLGAQGCLWTEWIASFPHAEYMLFPRLCALSEVVWSAKASRDWPDFQRRLAVHLVRLDELGVNHHP